MRAMKRIVTVILGVKVTAVRCSLWWPCLSDTVKVCDIMRHDIRYYIRKKMSFVFKWLSS